MAQDAKDVGNTKEAGSVPAGAGQAGPAIAPTVDEVQGVFAADAALQDAVARLTQAGFDHADLSLPVASPAPAAATPEQGATGVTTDIDMQQARTLGTSMAGSVGALAAAGLTVATGGALAAAAIAGAAGAVAIGGLTEAAGAAAGTAQHESRERAAEAGTLVLSVRVTSAARARTAEQAMQAAGATRIANVRRSTDAIDSAAWTG